MIRSANPTAASPGRQARALRAAMALTAGAAMTLTACSSGGSGAAGTAGTDIASVARTGVRDGGTLRWATDELPQTLNAYQADASADTETIAGATLPAMYRLDGHGAPQEDTDFLTGADVAQSPRQTVTYHLNPKAKWSDGRAVGAADFIAQWKALNGKNSAYWTSRNAGYDRISDVRQGKDAQQVEVTFATPYADWRSLFSPLYPKSVTSDADTFNDGVRTKLPVVAGPFAVKAVDSKKGTVTLVRNPSWWGDRAKLDQLVLTAVPMDKRAAALAAGTLDLAEIDPETVSKVAATKGLAVRKAPDAAYAQLAINGSTGPLADERVRHAVARAIDRKAIASSVLKPLGLPAEALGNHLVLPSQNGYHDNSSALGSNDIQQAQALLADAGWKRSTAKTGDQAAGGPGRTAASGAVTVVEPAAAVTKSGKQLSMRFVLPAGSPTLDAVGSRIATMLSGIGIRTEITKVDGDSYFQDHIASGDFDLALYSWPGTAYPATDDTPIFAKPVPAPDGSLTVAQNYTRVGTDQIDQLLDRAGGELDAGQARDLTTKADARIWAAAGSVPLYQRPGLVGLRTTVANAGVFGFETPVYQNLGFRK
ncbi:peptide/nickel transport system substrate-binding protein [Actinacidiphila alni]|uniref:Peptide/nickel transport system substrate-binding protein n=1 Tax=Actinacidiphila alni TaxID=380248 RepID=A0A1I2L8D9_9ACTN|nr:ABC transporter family substrate-binding protein [Actinacidiphila alni]SFF73737.1 peptide/nickel transport system substrate-binding protein [Actinacidiphila alni]